MSKPLSKIHSIGKDILAEKIPLMPDTRNHDTEQYAVMAIVVIVMMEIMIVVIVLVLVMVIVVVVLWKG